MNKYIKITKSVSVPRFNATSNTFAFDALEEGDAFNFNQVINDAGGMFITAFGVIIPKSCCKVVWA